MLTGFLDYLHTKGLKSTIESKKEDKYTIKVFYTNEQALLIVEMRELINDLGVLFLIAIQMQIDLMTAAEKSLPERPAFLRSFKKGDYFKNFVSQNVNNQ